MTDHPDANFGPALRPIRFDHALGEAETKRLYELQIQLDDRIDARGFRCTSRENAISISKTLGEIAK